ARLPHSNMIGRVGWSGARRGTAVANDRRPSVAGDGEMGAGGGDPREGAEAPRTWGWEEWPAPDDISIPRFLAPQAPPDARWEQASERYLEPPLPPSKPPGRTGPNSVEIVVGVTAALTALL